MTPFFALASLLAVATTTFPPTAAPAVPLSTVIDRVQKNYDQARDFRARFSQTYKNVAFGRTQSSSGELMFKKPGRMRWNYDKPDPKMFLSTGDVLWLHEPADKQAFKQDLKASQLPAALAFLMGKGKLTDEFEISLAKDIAFGKPTQHRLSLSPKRPQSSYKSIHFIVDPQSFFVTESVLVDAQGNVNHITFTDLRVNTKIPDAVFKWSPPAGTRVIDTAQAGKTGAK